MKPTRLTGFVAGGALLGAWLATAAGTREAPAVVVTPASRPALEQSETLVADVQAQTARLRERLAGAPAPLEPSRNPFTFQSTPRRERTDSAALVDPEPASVLTVPVAAPPAAEFTLIGVAESQTPDGLRRTAIIAGAGQLYMVSQDELVGSQYRVIAVGADAVELASVDGGVGVTLGLK